MRDWSHLKGVYAALITAFDNAGKVDLNCMCRMVDHMIAEGLSGFFICGSSGEGLLLSSEERKLIAQKMVEHVNGRAICIIHVGHTSTEEAARLASHAESIGADAVSSVPPIYFHVGPKETIDHYRLIAEATHLPVVVYNVPARTGISLTSEDMREIFQIENIVGMKYTATNYFEMRNIMELVEGECLMLSGADENFLAALSMGAHGSIGTTQNIMPRQYVEIHRAFCEERIADAQQLQYQANRVIRVLLRAGSIASWKAVLRAQGFPAGQARPPLRNVSPEEERVIFEEIRRVGMGRVLQPVCGC